MLNENQQKDVMLIYRDANDHPRFVKAKRALADRRTSWAFDTIAGRAKSKAGIGFYPTNPRQMSRWGAMDFDAHTHGDAVRARELAVAAVRILRRNPDLYLVLCTSGSDGWHVFIFSEDFHPVTKWTRMLKRVAAWLEVEIKAGLCEIFPRETAVGWPNGIRAPGTWNPKYDTFSDVVWQSVAPLLRLLERRKESPFLYHSTNGQNDPQLNDSGTVGLYRGQADEWSRRFAITGAEMRHQQLQQLVYNAFRHAGYLTCRRNAEAQHREAMVTPAATLSEHLEEFDELWAWTQTQWHGALSSEEKDAYATVTTSIQRDFFRIIRNFARKAYLDARIDFPLPVANVGNRLGVTFQYVAKLRGHFVEAGIIALTAPHVTNRTAARYRWLPQTCFASALLNNIEDA